jgi:hypothetical protein
MTGFREKSKNSLAQLRQPGHVQYPGYYQAAGLPGSFPLDGELNLPDRGYSYVVQEFSSRLAVKMSYEDAQEILSSFFPVKVPIRSLESILADVCDEVDQFYECMSSAEMGILRR